MDRQKLIEALNEQATVFDTESAHVEADRLLCEFLRELGHGDVVDAYDKVDKWYA